MIKLNTLLVSLCFILGAFSPFALAQTVSRDADDWDQLRGHRNIFALREALASHLPVSKGVRALGIAYIGAFSRDFSLSGQNLDYARDYAIAQRDEAFLKAVEHVQAVLMREQGRYQEMAADVARNSPTGGLWQSIVMHRAEKPTSYFMTLSTTRLENISPDQGRIIVRAELGGTTGTLLFDTGAESTLLSRDYAGRYGAKGSGIHVNMLTVDGPRVTELARLSSLGLGDARFGNVGLGVQNQRDGVIGFFLNEGATGILGFPLISRFGNVEFHVSGSRIASLTLHRPNKSIRSSDKPNMMIREDKPYIRVDMEDRVYSCIFDTGAPRSMFSSAIIARHQETLQLKALSPQAAKKAGLFRSAKAKVRYIAHLPVLAGNQEITLENVQILEGSGPASDFCLIGLDAVISSGGARMDIEDLQLQFGVNNFLAYNAYKLP